jgi:hypothetical protein
MDTIFFALTIYSKYKYEYLKVLRRTILRRTPLMIVLLNCLADNLEKDFTISKQLVTACWPAGTSTISSF